ncbi:MAG: glutathione S-transferase family protein [Bdellovibrionaceae bacterium]|nr:glutathione S-transferase family protein [Pseudobdellovibrionaceae bacterium]
MILVIGNKRLSSWSLRPWLMLKQFEIPFEEKLIPLDQPSTRSEILQYTESGKVPVLVDGDLTVWDSLAIAEYLNEKFPQKQMWPKDLKWRALARAVSCEMHSGFQVMRMHMSHDLQKQLTNFDYSKAQADIDRVKEIWTNCLALSGGPFLFGAFSIADAMYAPVVNRFVSYGVPSVSVCSEYIKTIRDLSSHADWISAGMKETYEAPLHS